MNFATTTTIGGGIGNVANFTSVGAVDVTSDIATTGSQEYQNLVRLNANAHSLEQAAPLPVDLMGMAMT